MLQADEGETPEDAEGFEDRVQQVLHEIDKWEIDPRNPPRLELDFGDLQNPEEVRMTARLVTDRVNAG